ncbi:MAG: hypothetical protein ACQEVA_06595 [Myxococcota bacterium]
MRIQNNPSRLLYLLAVASTVILTSCSVPPEGYEACGPPAGTYRVSLENPEIPSTNCEQAVTQNLSRFHDLYLTADDVPCPERGEDNLSLYVQVETISVENEGECDVYMEFNGQTESDRLTSGPATAEVKCSGDDLYCYHRFDSTYEYLGEERP